mgnify:CR=1 FL=1
MRVCHMHVSFQVSPAVKDRRAYAAVTNSICDASCLALGFRLPLPPPSLLLPLPNTHTRTHRHAAARCALHRHQRLLPRHRHHPQREHHPGARAAGFMVGWCVCVRVLAPLVTLCRRPRCSAPCLAVDGEQNLCHEPPRPTHFILVMITQFSMNSYARSLPQDRLP